MTEQQILIRDQRLAEMFYRFSVRNTTPINGVKPKATTPLIEVPISEQSARQILADLRHDFPCAEFELIELCGDGKWMVVTE